MEENGCFFTDLLKCDLKIRDFSLHIMMITNQTKNIINRCHVVIIMQRDFSFLPMPVKVCYGYDYNVAI